MKGLNFKYKNFLKQDLSHWFLVGANLQGAYLCQANLCFANLRGADLRGAFYDKNTVFPDGFDPDAAGMRRV